MNDIAISDASDQRERPAPPRLATLRRTLRCLGVVVSVLASVAMVAIATGIVWFRVGFQPVLSGSMRPTFSPGSVVLTRPIATSNVRVGDVILFRPPGYTSSFAHRVTSVSGAVDRPVITTKGDANPVVDPWKVQLATARVPEVIGSIPRLGRMLVAIHKRGGRLLLILGGGLAFGAVGTRAILGPRPRDVVADAVEASPA